MIIYQLEDLFFNVKCEVLRRRTMPLWNHASSTVSSILYVEKLESEFLILECHRPIPLMQAENLFLSFVCDYIKIELVYVMHEIYIQNKEKFDMNNPVHYSKVRWCSTEI